jgi:radical SAM-linked protein
MVVDRLTPAALPAGEAEPSKFRIRFQKSGDLRFVSHHDLLHCFERMLRRSGLPFVCTQGFHPHPRIVFPLSLALGIAGCREVVEIEFAGTLTADQVSDQLRSHAPPGLDIGEVRAIARRTRGQPFRASYRVHLPQAPPDLMERITVFLAASTAFVERERPTRKRINVRPFVSGLRAQDDFLAMDLWITPNGAARPEEILRALGLQDLPTDGLLIERTDLELIDEADQSGCSEWNSLCDAVDPAQVKQSTEESKAESAPGRRQPTPLLSGPLSFDS